MSPAVDSLASGADEADHQLALPSLARVGSTLVYK
jgi:hypothetical protein